MRHCHYCGTEVRHFGEASVCESPECSRAFVMSKHLRIYPLRSCYLVFLVREELRDTVTGIGTALVTRPLYFGTELEAKDFVAQVRVGISVAELAPLIEAHRLPPERITIEELRRRATTND